VKGYWFQPQSESLDLLMASRILRVASGVFFPIIRGDTS
jgi:hypothetical protein